jgi:hypothetical protein
MTLFNRKVRRWQRRGGWLLAGLFVIISCTVLPAPAQEFDQSPFCVATDDPLTDSVQGRSYGDPHINTYDQLHYSFQTVGEYVLSQSQDGRFVVQTRQRPVGDSRALSLNTAVAMGVCGHRVGLYIQNPPDGRTPLWVDGVPTPIIGGVLPLPNGGEVQFLGEDYAIIWPSGDQVRVHPISVSGDEFYNIMITLSRRHGGRVTGLLGNFNANPDDDLMSRGGTILPAQSSYSVATNTLAGILPAAIPVRQVEDAYFDNLYRQFGDSWRVSPGESLFDYGPGQSTAAFSDPDFPRDLFTLNAVPPNDLENAVNTCEEAGVDEAQMDGCVFDVAATGEPSFANAALSAVGEVVVQEVTDRLLDEVRDAVPIPGLPF